MSEIRRGSRKCRSFTLITDVTVDPLLITDVTERAEVFNTFF